MNWKKDLIGRGCGLFQVTYWYCMEGLRKTLKDLRMSGILPKIWTRHLQNTSLDHHTAQTVLVYNMNILGVYTKNKIWCSCSTYMHITSILLNAAVAVCKLSHMPCFVQTAFFEWVCTVTHYDKWNVFLFLTVLCYIACSCHYAVHVALFCDSTEKCVVKNVVCSDVTLC
jgi:hypothetical protein